jgi:DinB superfamily
MIDVLQMAGNRVAATAVPTGAIHQAGLTGPALLVVLFVGSMMTNVFAQGPGANRVAAIFQNQLTLVESDVVSLAEAMPAEKYDFKPTAGEFAGVRTFGEQVKHLATMIYMTSAIVLEEKSPYGPGTNDNGPDDVKGKEAIVAYLKASIAYARKAMGSLTEQNALDPLKTYFGSQPRAEVASGVAYHSYDHYGQMVVYARMNGIVPPASRR